MTNDTMSLRVLQNDVSLKEVFNPDFLKKLEENFDNLEIIPIGIAFVLKDGEINADMINISYRNDEEIDSNTVLIDVQTDPKNMDIIRKTFE
jgi:hypothetical protein